MVPSPIRRLRGFAPRERGVGRDLPRPIDVTTLDWVRWDEAWKRIPTEKWVDAHVPPAQVRARINTSLALTEPVAAGLGVGFHSCWAGVALIRARSSSQIRSF